MITTSSKSGQGAAVGGALGWYSAKGKKSSKRYRNAIIGAGAGAAVSSKAQGDRSGAIYSVKTGEGSFIEVVSDQTEMKIGDCVVVEESGKKANVRRIDPTACQPESAEAVSQLQEEMVEEAVECATAKQDIIDAKTNDDLDLAIRKAKILCNS
jgi:hypothetical protein